MNKYDVNNLTHIRAGITVQQMVFLIAISLMSITVFIPYAKFPVSAIWLFVLSVGLCVIGLFFERYLSFSNKFSATLLFLVVLVTLIGMVYSSADNQASQYFIIMLSMLITYICIANSLWKVNTLLIFVIIGCILNAISVLWERLSSASFFSIAEKLLDTNAFSAIQTFYARDVICGIGGYSNVSSYVIGILFVISFAYLFELVRKRKAHESKVSIWKIYFLIALLVFCIYLITITGKRGILVATIIASFVIFLMNIRYNRKLLWPAIILFIILIAAIFLFVQYSVAGQIMWQRFFANDGDITTGRTDIYTYALQNWKSWMLFGNGTSEGLLNAESIGISGGLHNIYIQIFYEHGIVGGSIYFIWMIYNLLNVFKQLKHFGNVLWIFISCGIQVFFLVYGLFGNPLFEYYELFFYVFGISILDAYGKDYMR